MPNGALLLISIALTSPWSSLLTMIRGIFSSIIAVALLFSYVSAFILRDPSYTSQSLSELTLVGFTRSLDHGSQPTRYVKQERTTAKSAFIALDSSTKSESEIKLKQTDKGYVESTIFGFPRDTVAAPLALLLFSQFMLFIGVGAVIPSIPLYGKEIGFSSAANGVVISAPAVAMLIGSKWGGNFADANRKPAMLLGMAIIAVSDIGTALANGIVMLVVARLGLGAGRCISESGERGMLADLAQQVPELRGGALAAQSAVIALGIAIGGRSLISLLLILCCRLSHSNFLNFGLSPPSSRCFRCRLRSPARWNRCRGIWTKGVFFVCQCRCNICSGMLSILAGNTRAISR